MFTGIRGVLYDALVMLCRVSNDYDVACAVYDKVKISIAKVQFCIGL